MRRFAAAVVCAATAGLLASCMPMASPPGVDPATWELADPAVVTAEATTLEVLVTRLECASGVTGDLEAPAVVYGRDEIVIPVDAAYNGDGAADCRGNDAVPLSITLTEPVGDRVLIDGACRDTGAADTTLCDSPVRWSP